MVNKTTFIMGLLSTIIFWALAIALFFFLKNDPTYNKIHHKNIEGVVQISLPFVSGDANIVKSDDTENWATTIATLKSLHLHPPAFHSLCADKLQSTKAFAHAVFGKSCSPEKHAKVGASKH